MRDVVVVLCLLLAVVSTQPNFYDNINRCSSSQDGTRFPHASMCHMYVECSNGKENEQHCPMVGIHYYQGLRPYFDVISMECKDDTRVPCYIQPPRATTETTTTTTIPTTTTTKKPTTTTTKKPTTTTTKKPTTTTTKKPTTTTTKKPTTTTTKKPTTTTTKKPTTTTTKKPTTTTTKKPTTTTTKKPTTTTTKKPTTTTTKKPTTTTTKKPTTTTTKKPTTTTTKKPTTTTTQKPTSTTTDKPTTASPITTPIPTCNTQFALNCTMYWSCGMGEPTLESCSDGYIFYEPFRFCLPGDIETCELHHV